MSAHQLATARMRRAEWWDGKEVWVVLNKSEGLWRQAKVVASVPPPLDQPGGDWEFVIDTKHDNWRHLIAGTPSDEQGSEFEFIKLTDAALMPSVDDPYKKWVAPAWFDIVPEGSPVYKVKDGSVSVHPYISEEIIELRKLYREAEQTVKNLSKDLKASQAESALKSEEIERLLALLKKEQDERVVVVTDLTSTVIIQEQDNVSLKVDNSGLVLQTDDLRTMLNEVQEENNKLRVRLKIMTEELVRFKAIVVTQQHEIDEKIRQVTYLTRENADLTELLRLEREKFEDLQARYQILFEEHSPCGYVRQSLEEEIERLRRRKVESGPCYQCEVYQREYENVWKALISQLESLSIRVAALEARERVPMGAVDELPPAEPLDDDSTRRKRASALGGQVDGLMARVVYLEDLLNRPPEVTTPVPHPQLPRSPDIDNELLRRLMEMVKFLTIRNDDLIRYVRELRPKYVPTYRSAAITSSITTIGLGTGASAYDGDFPWLVSKRVADLEKENRLLRDQHEITTQRHYELLNRTDIALSPVLKENGELRGKIDRYREDLVLAYARLSEAEKVIEKARRAGVVDGLLGAVGVSTEMGI